MTMDYKDTVRLPKTDFAMRAGLPTKEPEMLKKWKEINLYNRIMELRKDNEPFILHDGPPYANGNLHLGHALNKILKDFIVRSQSMFGRYSPYVPGWDCHGLPIEWKVEEKYRKKKKNKDEIPINVFRNECREFAANWVDIQKEQFQRLGGMADWDNPYLTMTYAAEAKIAEEIGKFLLNGSLYLGAKPVLWSVVEKTALAEAEIEYDDHHVSDSIYVGFDIVHGPDEQLIGTKALIWTTTAWTIPANRGIAYGPEVKYGVYEVKEVGEASLAQIGQKILIAKDLAENVAEKCQITNWQLIYEPASLEGMIAHHPWHDKGYDYDVPLVSVDYVEVETGTGLVHTAPNHGEDDWHTGRKYNLSMSETVLADGTYSQNLPIVQGMHIFKIVPIVLENLKEVGALLGHGKLTHSYPLSWRSKAPLIYRNTPQWFIALDDENTIRDTALKALEDVEFFPKQGRNRLTSMVTDRPDWCVSRQRVWGVPIAIFTDKKTNQPLRDAEVMAKIVEVFKEEGADAWFSSPKERFLGKNYNVDDYDQVMDILDVWFDSGSTHAFVLEEREELLSPANLYLEGSDQHRGWFQSSLLESCGTRGRAPYKQILTHGFLLDDKGYKMSKSLGNTVEPQEITNQYGADILRLWVANSDFSGEIAIGNDILKGVSDIYRRLRNTLRWMLGNLAEFSPEENLSYNELPELEQYILHRLYELDNERKKYVGKEYAFHKFFNSLHNFCTLELSAIYFDIRKDTLYCDGKNSINRKAARTVLNILFDSLTTWMAPFLCFTAEEAWLERYPEAVSIHLEIFREADEKWHNPTLAQKWQRLLDVRKVVTGALEIERKEKRIGSSLQAAPKLYVDEATATLLEMEDLADFFITSEIEVLVEAAPQDAYRIEDIEHAAVVFNEATEEKCPRCWKQVKAAGNHEHPELCPRCVEAVKG
ncbi:MAG: isoleucine--tRNA ligase [Alphaproteobacteria bacterium]